MTDFRARCQELIDEIDAKAYGIKSLPSSVAIERARAALAQPEPQGPSDEELLASVRHFYGDQAAADMGAEDDLRTARAVLAHWGRPAIDPVPVSERLPGPEDCDAEGRCWFFHTSTIGGNEWFLNQLPKVSEWYRWQSITHWLPHWALPVPAPANTINQENYE